MTYQRTDSSSALIACGLMPSPYYSLHDTDSWESFSDEDLVEFVRTSARTFTEHIETLALCGEPVTPRERRELTFMLESLVHAQRLACERAL